RRVGGIIANNWYIHKRKIRRKRTSSRQLDVTMTILAYPSAAIGCPPQMSNLQFFADKDFPCNTALFLPTTLIGTNIKFHVVNALLRHLVTGPAAEIFSRGIR